MTEHNPILSIFQLAPDDGSIQAGGPFYRCTECDATVVMLEDHGRDRPTHLTPEQAAIERAAYQRDMERGLLI